MSDAQMNELIAKRLALGMALMCVRNTSIEDIHAGVEPSSKAGDFSDVKVVTPYGEIPWNSATPPESETNPASLIIQNQSHQTAKRCAIETVFIAQSPSEI